MEFPLSFLHQLGEIATVLPQHLNEIICRLCKRTCRSYRRTWTMPRRKVKRCFGLDWMGWRAMCPLSGRMAPVYRNRAQGVLRQSASRTAGSYSGLWNIEVREVESRRGAVVNSTSRGHYGRCELFVDAMHMCQARQSAKQLKKSLDDCSWVEQSDPAPVCLKRVACGAFCRLQCVFADEAIGGESYLLNGGVGLRCSPLACSSSVNNP